MQGGAKNLCGVVLLQPDPRSVSGVTAQITEFIKSLKWLTARGEGPSKIYSDNGHTFVAAAKWLKKVRKDEMFHSFLVISPSFGSSTSAEHPGGAGNSKLSQRSTRQLVKDSSAERRYAKLSWTSK